MHFDLFVYKQHFTKENISSKIFQASLACSLHPYPLKDQMWVRNSKFFCRFSLIKVKWRARKTAVQNQPFANGFQNGCSLKFHKFHRKTDMLKSLFNEAAVPQAWNFIKKRLHHKCFPVKLVNCLRNYTFFAEHLKWLVLELTK